MDLKEQTIAGLRWSAIQNWGSQFGSLLVFLVLARLLTPDAFGLVALANVFRSFLQLFVEQGFIQALVQRDDLQAGHLDSAFWTQLLAGVVLTGICFAIATPVAGYFEQPDVAAVLKVLSLVLVIKSFALVQTALLRRSFDFRTLATSSIAGIAVSGVVGIPLALNGYGVWSLVGQQLTYECVSTFLLWRGSSWRPGREVSRRHLRELRHYAIHVIGYRIVEFSSRRADHLLVSFFLGEVALGFYSVAHRVLEVMTQVLVMTIRQVAFPAFSRLQTQPQRLRGALVQAVRYTSLVTFPIFLGTAAVAGELVPQIFGDKWLDATVLVQTLAVSGIVVTLSGLLEMVLMATGRPAQRLKLGLLTAAVTLPACAFAVQWGIEAVALAYVLSHAAVLPIIYRAAVDLAPGGSASPARAIVLPLAAALLMAGVLLWVGPLRLTDNGTLALIVEVVAGAALYAATIAVFAPRVFGEFREMLAIAWRGPESAQ